MRWVSDIILPGEHGIGSVGFTPTTDNYGKAADHLVRLHNENCYVDTSDYEVHRVLEFYGASSMDELRIKRRGW